MTLIFENFRGRLSKAGVYHSYHGMQDRDASLVLREYQSKMKWNHRHKILDIGCGPGDLTVNYLLPLVPKNGELVRLLKKKNYYIDY